MSSKPAGGGFALRVVRIGGILLLFLSFLLFVKESRRCLFKGGKRVNVSRSVYCRVEVVSEESSGGARDIKFSLTHFCRFLPPGNATELYSFLLGIT